MGQISLITRVASDLKKELATRISVKNLPN
jgi:hypothetical protein